MKSVTVPAALAIVLLSVGAGLGTWMATVHTSSTRIGTTQSPIHHLFFLIKENHAFENYFGMYPGALGFPPVAALPATFGSRHTVATHPIVGSNTTDLPHDRDASLADSHGGKNDWFVAVAAARHYGLPSDAAGYYGPAQIPAYYSYARNFTLADRFFSGVLGPTLPNRIFDFAGTSGNWTSNAAPPPDAMEFPTIFDQLNSAGLRWAYDYSGSSYLLPPLFFPTLNQSGIVAQDIRPMTELPSQLSSPSPPAVTFLDPEHDPLYSEHPPSNVTLGANWTVAVLNAIFSSPIASSSAVFLFYDEGGGYWDPIAPPNAGPYGDGFRVPLLVVSPWARTGFLDDQQLDPASLLRFVEDNWHLPYLNLRIQTAPALAGVFNFSGSPHEVGMQPTNVALNATFPLFVSGLHSFSSLRGSSAEGAAVAPNLPRAPFVTSGESAPAVAAAWSFSRAECGPDRGLILLSRAGSSPVRGQHE